MTAVAAATVNKAALAALPGVTREEASLLSRSSDLILNPARSGALVTIASDLYFYDFASSKVTRLTNEGGEEEQADHHGQRHAGAALDHGRVGASGPTFSRSSTNVPSEAAGWLDRSWRT